MASPTVPAQRIATLSADAGEAWWWFGGLALIKVAGHQTEGKYSLIELLYPPNLEVPLHVHTREDELFYVLEGKIAYRVGDVRAEVSAGHTVFAPRNIPHGFIVTSPEPARYLIVYSPSGFEGFIRDSSTPAHALVLPPAAPPPTPAQIEALTAMMRDGYGCYWASDHGSK
jgi:quercetin dioxygenase-like cupin family protein